MTSLAEKPLTGEPDAGDPPVRFGGRGEAQTLIPTSILDINPFPYTLSAQHGGISGILTELNW